MPVKRCPKCNRVYGDEIRFCLDDGSPLAHGYESDPTIVSPPPVVVAPSAQPWQYPSPQIQPAPVRHSSVIAYVLIPVVAFLALLVGGGVVFLLKSGEGTDSNTTGTSSPSPISSPSPYPSPSQQDSKVAVPSPSRNNNGGSSSVGGYDAVESRLVRGDEIGTSDLAGMSADELRRLRNAIYARHGRMFNTPELQRYFDSKPWYTRRSNYSEQDLTAVDKRNLNLIMAAEKGAR